MVMMSAKAEEAPPVYSSGGGYYESVLKESIDRWFLPSSESRVNNDLFSIFSRLVHSSADPPLEIIWFYSAIITTTSSSSASSSSSVAALKDLVQLLTSLSSSSSSEKSIALLAPAVSRIYSCSKTAKKKKTESLLDGLLSYIAICSSTSNNTAVDDGVLLPCFNDLVRVWTPCFNDFFPLVTDEIRARFDDGDNGCQISYLAGVVIAEVFLLRLCFKVGGSSAEDVRSWAVSSITALRNHVFFDILLRMLLSSTLPVASLIDAKDENYVKDILYDAVILVDYSFLHPGMVMHSSYDMTSLAIRRLIVINDAIRIAREKGNHEKAISYMNAFSASRLPSEIIKWVCNHAGIEKIKRPNTNTPQVLLKWIADLEDQGVKVYENSLVKHRSKLMLEESKDASMLTSERKQAEDDLFFFDNEGEDVEDEDMQSVDAAFLAAAQTMKSPASNGTKKRKETRSEAETGVKFIKYKFHSSDETARLSSSAADGTGSGSEVDDPFTDDEMDETY